MDASAYFQLTPSFDYLNLHRPFRLPLFFAHQSMSHWLIKLVAQETATVISFMMGEDGVRFAQLVHELQPRIRAFQITQFMCSAWMKPVCTHTMGHGHKTVNASPILADPSVWRSFSFKERIFHRSPVSFIRASHSWIVGSDMEFISLYFWQKKIRFHYVGQTDNSNKYIHHVLIRYE